jgi:hypothetical protein
MGRCIARPCRRGSRERREIAREVLLCFHGAARLSRGGGQHARLGGVMGAVSLDVLYIILVGAEFKAEDVIKVRWVTSASFSVASAELLWWKQAVGRIWCCCVRRVGVEGAEHVCCRAVVPLAQCQKRGVGGFT